MNTTTIRPIATHFRLCNKLNTFVKFEDYMEWSNLNRTQKTAYGMQMNNFFAENEIYDEHGQRIEPWMN